MLGKPKYKFNDKVKFALDNETFIGSIYIIDSYGTFEDDSDVSYDVMVENWGERKEECLFKHINEKLIISKIIEKEYVDLGLSVKWANYNEGSDSPENKGCLYTYEKAIELFGDKMPTIENWLELQKNCTFKFDCKSLCFKVIGPNGNSILLPITKEKEGNFRETGAYFYSSTKTKTINPNTGMEDVWFAGFTVNQDICTKKYKKINKIDCYLLSLKHQYELSIRTVQK